MLILGQEPELFWAHFLRAVGHQKLKNLSEARASLTVCVGKRPDFGDSTAESHDPMLEEVRDALTRRANDTDLFHFEHDHSRYIALAAPITFSSLLDKEMLVLTVPVSDFTRESDRLLRRALAVSAALLLAGFAASLMASRLITRSLSALTKQAMHLGDLEFRDAPPLESRIAEINTLAAALGSARDAIRTFALYVPRELVRKIVASGLFAGRTALRQEVTVLPDRCGATAPAKGLFLVGVEY